RRTSLRKLVKNNCADGVKYLTCDRLLRRLNTGRDAVATVGIDSSLKYLLAKFRGWCSPRVWSFVVHFARWRGITGSFRARLHNCHRCPRNDNISHQRFNLADLRATTRATAFVRRGSREAADRVVEPGTGKDGTELTW